MPHSSGFSTILIAILCLWPWPPPAWGAEGCISSSDAVWPSGKEIPVEKGTMSASELLSHGADFCAKNDCKVSFMRVADAETKKKAIKRALHRAKTMLLLGCKKKFPKVHCQIGDEDITLLTPYDISSKNLQDFVDVCGSKIESATAGLADDTRLVICPALLINAIKSGDVSDYLFYTLAHEMGHRLSEMTKRGIIEDVVPYHRPLAQCHVTSYGAKASQIRESVADQLAAMALAWNVKLMQVEGTSARTFLQRTLNVVSGKAGSGYPDKDTRLKIILGDPDLRKSMDCPKSPAASSCSVGMK